MKELFTIMGRTSDWVVCTSRESSMICCHRRGEHAVFKNCSNHYGTSAKNRTFKVAAKNPLFVHESARITLITMS